MNQPDRIETRLIKHVFSTDEKVTIGSELARQEGVIVGIEKELESFKATNKSQMAAAEARRSSLSMDLVNGYKMTEARVWAKFKPKEKIKEWRLEGDGEETTPVLVEQMTADDFQMDLIRMEGQFAHREEIELFKPAASSHGKLIVGKFNDRWFYSLRIDVSGRRVEEHLNPEAASYKERKDCVANGCKRAFKWLVESLGEDAADGFREAIFAIPGQHTERVE